MEKNNLESKLSILENIYIIGSKTCMYYINLKKKNLKKTINFDDFNEKKNLHKKQHEKKPF